MRSGWRLSVALACASGLLACGPSAEDPDPEWFVGEWFYWHEECEEGCWLSGLTELVVRADGTAELREDMVCGLEGSPKTLELESDGSSAILLSTPAGEPRFNWEAGNAGTLRLSYENSCWSRAEVVEPEDWHAPQPSSMRAGPAHAEGTPMDCDGPIVLEEGNPCPDAWGRPP